MSTITESERRRRKVEEAYALTLLAGEIWEVPEELKKLDERYINCEIDEEKYREACLAFIKGNIQ